MQPPKKHHIVHGGALASVQHAKRGESSTMPSRLWSCRHTCPHTKKDDALHHRSLVIKLERVGLHLIEPRPHPWGRLAQVHLHDIRPIVLQVSATSFALVLKLVASISS